MDSGQAKGALFEAIALDGQGVCQPASAGAARPARSGAAHGRGARAGERPVERQHLAAPPGAPRRGYGHARSARAPASATRSPGDEVAARSGLRCATSRPRAWPRWSGPPRTTSAKTSSAIGREELRRRGSPTATSCSWTCAPPRSSPPGTSRARARSRSTSSSNGSLSCRTTAEIVAYCRGPFCAYAHEAVRRLKPQDARPAGSRRAGPSGSSAEQSRPDTSIHGEEAA